MSKRRDYGSVTSQVDMTTNMLLLFVGLFVVAFIAMRIKIEKSKKVDAKAEFMITVTWPKECGDDVDTYTEDPLGNLVFFRRREEGLMHLDRDDLGMRNDRVRDAFGNIIEIKENQEIVTIRGIVPGEYIVNAHMYRKVDKEPIEVKVLLQKLNPEVQTIRQRVVKLSKHGDEETAFRFIIDKDGEVTDVNEIEKVLAGPRNAPQYSGPELEAYDGTFSPEPEGNNE